DLRAAIRLATAGLDPVGGGAKLVPGDVGEAIAVDIAHVGREAAAAFQGDGQVRVEIGPAPAAVGHTAVQRPAARVHRAGPEHVGPSVAVEVAAEALVTLPAAGRVVPLGGREGIGQAAGVEAPGVEEVPLVGA